MQEHIGGLGINGAGNYFVPPIRCDVPVNFKEYGVHDSLHPDVACVGWEANSPCFQSNTKISHWMLFSHSQGAIHQHHIFKLVPPKLLSTEMSFAWKWCRAAVLGPCQVHPNQAWCMCGGCSLEGFAMESQALLSRQK